MKKQTSFTRISSHSNLAIRQIQFINPRAMFSNRVYTGEGWKGLRDDPLERSVLFVRWISMKTNQSS